MLSFLSSPKQIDRERGLSSLALLLAKPEMKDETLQALTAQAMSRVKAASGSAFAAEDREVTLTTALSTNPPTENSSREKRYAPLVVLKAVVDSRSKNKCRDESLEGILQHHCMQRGGQGEGSCGRLPPVSRRPPGPISFRVMHGKGPIEHPREL